MKQGFENKTKRIRRKGIGKIINMRRNGGGGGVYREKRGRY